MLCIRSKMGLSCLEIFTISLIVKDRCIRDGLLLFTILQNSAIQFHQILSLHELLSIRKVVGSNIGRRKCNSPNFLGFWKRIQGLHLEVDTTLSSDLVNVLVVSRSKTGNVAVDKSSSNEARIINVIFTSLR